MPEETGWQEIVSVLADAANEPMIGSINLSVFWTPHKTGMLGALHVVTML